MSLVLKDVHHFFIPVLLMFPFCALTPSFSEVRLFKGVLCILNGREILCREFMKFGEEAHRDKGPSWSHHMKGACLSPWLITADVGLDHLAEVCLPNFSTVKLHVLCPSLYHTLWKEVNMHSQTSGVEVEGEDLHILRIWYDTWQEGMKFVDAIKSKNQLPLNKGTIQD